MKQSTGKISLQYQFEMCKNNAMANRKLIRLILLGLLWATTSIYFLLHKHITLGSIFVIELFAFDLSFDRSSESSSSMPQLCKVRNVGVRQGLVFASLVFDICLKPPFPFLFLAVSACITDP